jgi:hypothetical protein
LTLLKKTHLLGLLHININLGRRIGIVNTVGQKKFYKGVSRKINSGDKIDNINQDSDIEKGEDSSEELDDDTVHQNVQFVNSIKS